MLSPTMLRPVCPLLLACILSPLTFGEGVKVVSYYGYDDSIELRNDHAYDFVDMALRGG